MRPEELLKNSWAKPVFPDAIHCAAFRRTAATKLPGRTYARFHHMHSPIRESKMQQRPRRPRTCPILLGAAISHPVFSMNEWSDCQKKRLNPFPAPGCAWPLPYSRSRTSPRDVVSFNILTLHASADSAIKQYVLFSLFTVIFGRHRIRSPSSAARNSGGATGGIALLARPHDRLTSRGRTCLSPENADAKTSI
jgi:hypothetical protein